MQNTIFACFDAKKRNVADHDKHSLFDTFIECEKCLWWMVENTKNTHTRQQQRCIQSKSIFYVMSPHCFFSCLNAENSSFYFPLSFCHRNDEIHWKMSLKADYFQFLVFPLSFSLLCMV